MREIAISLTTIEDVKSFVGISAQYACDIDIVSDKYVVDAKSILGIFSIDLSKPLTLRIDTDDADMMNEIIGKLRPFLSKNI